MTSIAVVTMTWARSNQERALLLDSFASLERTGLPVYVADGGSDAGFVSALSQFANFRVRKEGSNLVRQIRASIDEASANGVDLVVYTEPDKKRFFDGHLRKFLVRALELPKSPLVVAARNQPAFDTFPVGQRRIEGLFNELANFFLGSAGDFLYGPMILNCSVIHEYVAEVPEDLGWGWRTYLMSRCSTVGHQLEFYSGPFECPEEQRAEDDREARLHRLFQFSQNVAGLRRGLLDGARQRIY